MYDELEKIVGKFSVPLILELFPTMNNDTSVIVTHNTEWHYIPDDGERYATELNEWHIQSGAMHLYVRCAFIKHINTLVIYEPQRK